MVNCQLSAHTLGTRLLMAISCHPGLLELSQRVSDDTIEQALSLVLSEHPEILSQFARVDTVKPSLNVALFVRDECIVDKNLTIKVDDLYRAYVDWCARERYVPVNKAHFGREIRKLIPGLRLYKPWQGDKGPGEGRKQWYRGIGLA